MKIVNRKPLNLLFFFKKIKGYINCKDYEK